MRKSKWDQAVQKLMELTNSGQLKWTAGCSPADYPEFERENVVGLPYFASVAEQDLVIYEARVKTIDEYEDQLFWKHFVAIESVTDRGVLQIAWQVGDEAALWDLLNAVRFHTSETRDFLEKLLVMDVKTK